jgi:hypothetical protein
VRAAFSANGFNPAHAAIFIVDGAPVIAVSLVACEKLGQPQPASNLQPSQTAFHHGTVARRHQPKRFHYLPVKALGTCVAGDLKGDGLRLLFL